MVCKQDASKRLFEMKELEPEPESPFLDEAAYDLPTREEAWDSYEAEPEPQLETPFASAFAPADQENSGLAAEEGIEGEIEPEALEELEAPAREPEDDTGEEEGEFAGSDVLGESNENLDFRQQVQHLCPDREGLLRWEDDTGT